MNFVLSRRARRRDVHSDPTVSPLSRGRFSNRARLLSAQFYSFSITKMAPKVKLLYFDGRGRGEMIRIMLSYGGVEFEDKRIKMEEWPQVKPSK